MRKSFLFVLGICLALNNTCYAVGGTTQQSEIGRFIALKGADGIDGTNGTDACPPLISSDTKNAQGCFVVKQKSQVRSNGTCQASGEWSTISTVCDCRPTETRTPCGHGTEEACGTAGRAGYKIVTTQCDGSGPTTSYIYDNNCGITVASTTDVHQDNDPTKPVTHKRVAFKNTCTNEPLSTTADVPVGCTPTYTQKYINKENGSFTYNNDSRGENTIGARVTVSGCGNDNSFDTYDGNDGTSFNYKGSVANCSALNNVSNPAQNDAYIVNGNGNGKLCIYNGSSWPTCPSGCAEFTGPAGASNCTGFESSPTAVKHTLRTYSGPSDSTTNSGVTFYATRGKTVLTHKMCNTSLNDTVDNENDPCVPIIAPSGVTCNGTYMECKRGDNSTTYNVCEATTGTTFSSALSNKEDDPCAGVASSSQSATVKKTEWSYTAPTGSSVGKLVQKNRMCDNSLSTSSLAVVEDECTEEARPSSGCNGSTKVYKKCRPQGTYASNTSFSDYYVCVDGTYKDVCLGTASSSLSTTERTQSTAYTVPSGTKSGSGDYSYYTSSPGKMVTTSVKCNPGTSGGNNTVIGSVQDVCDEIAKPSNVCTDSSKKFYQCRPQGKINNSTEPYYLCTNPLGVSVLDTINSAAQTAVAAVDPCAGNNTNSSTIIKTTSTTAYSRGTKNGNLYPNIGSKTVTKTACDGTTTYTTTEQDSCVEIAKPANVCTAATSAYLRCYNAQASSDKTYYVCQDLGTNNSLANKIDAKADASAVTQSALANTLGSTYLKPSDTISTSQLPSNVVTTTDGKINAGVLPSTVVTVGDDATHGLNTLLSSALSTGTLKDVVTSGTLNGYVKTTGTDNNSISTILSSNNVVTTTNVGNCTAGTTTGKNTLVTCTDNSLAGQLLEALLPAINAAAGGNTVVREQ